jgi:hypothetical protein
VEFGIRRLLCLTLFLQDGLVAPLQLGNASLTALARFPALGLVRHGNYGVV